MLPGLLWWVLIHSSDATITSKCSSLPTCSDCLGYHPNLDCGWCELTLGCIDFDPQNVKNNSCWRLPVPEEAVEVIGGGPNPHRDQCGGPTSVDGPLLFEANYEGRVGSPPAFPTTGMDTDMLLKGEHLGPFAHLNPALKGITPWRVHAGPFDCSLAHQSNVSLEDAHGYYNQVDPPPPELVRVPSPFKCRLGT